MVKWKREKVQDHKFDFVDVEQFEKKGFANKIKYSYVFLIVLKSVLVYLADLYNAGGLILSDLGDKWGGITPKIPFSISRWVFLGSVVVSFILLFIEVRKAKKIIASGDISYAFTSTVATRYYTLTSYAHWCFFQEIINQQRTQDRIAFFVFFAFKGWKRLIFCDGPRQTSFNCCYTFHCHGNLKEYCCHIIDKRIAELLLKQRKNRKKDGKALKAPKHLAGVAPTLPSIDDDKESYNQMSPQMRPPVAYGMPPPTDPYIMGKPNIPQNYSPPPQIMYNHQHSNSAGSLEDKYPERPDSNNSNSAYSDTSTKYSAGQGRTPYPYPPQHQYPYQQMPKGGFNDNVDPYGQKIPYNPPNQYHEQNYYDANDYNDYDYNNYSPSQKSPQNTQFFPTESARQQITNAIPPSQRNNVRYQQNRPYNNYQSQGNPRY
ncbi:vacuole protein, putative [Rhizophagus irregularis DAOM 181602=DAOM 197198]|nr:vacuole protein, putative [Rhizophagus irregularis DAOM 181602=DAOM 197198]